MSWWIWLIIGIVTGGLAVFGFFWWLMYKMWEGF